MNDTIKRTSRNAESRDVNERKKTWTLPSSLDAPKAPNGYEHRWIRTNVQGFEDTSNVTKKLREGWEFVKAEELKNDPDINKYPQISEGKYIGCIGIGGLVLARIPTEILRQRQEYFARLTQDQIKGVDNDLLKEQHPSMPISKPERQSRVTFGGNRKN